MIFAVAASVLIVAALATWVAIRRHDSQLVARSALIDLRNRSMVRGTEPPRNEPPIEIDRNVSRLEIYLPLGTSDGSYDVRITTVNGELLVTRRGVAKIQGGITSLLVDLNVSSISPGLYVLELQKIDSERNSYAVRIR